MSPSCRAILYVLPLNPATTKKECIMKQTDRKPYAGPDIQELGALRDITESGDVVPADQPDQTAADGPSANPFVS